MEVGKVKVVLKGCKLVISIWLKKRGKTMVVMQALYCESREKRVAWLLLLMRDGV